MARPRSRRQACFVMPTRRSLGLRVRVGVGGQGLAEWVGGVEEMGWWVGIRER